MIVSILCTITLTTFFHFVYSIEFFFESLVTIKTIQKSLYSTLTITKPKISLKRSKLVLKMFLLLNSRKWFKVLMQQKLKWYELLFPYHTCKYEGSMTNDDKQSITRTIRHLCKKKKLSFRNEIPFLLFIKIHTTFAQTSAATMLSTRQVNTIWPVAVTIKERGLF